MEPLKLIDDKTFTEFVAHVESSLNQEAAKWLRYEEVELGELLGFARVTRGELSYWETPPWAEDHEFDPTVKVLVRKR